MTIIDELDHVMTFLHFVLLITSILFLSYIDAFFVMAKIYATPIFIATKDQILISCNCKKFNESVAKFYIQLFVKLVIWNLKC